MPIEHLGGHLELSQDGEPLGEGANTATFDG
jgi:hypothetical protein